MLGYQSSLPGLDLLLLLPVLHPASCPPAHSHPPWTGLHSPSPVATEALTQMTMDSKLHPLPVSSHPLPPPQKPLGPALPMGPLSAYTGLDQVPGIRHTGPENIWAHLQASFRMPTWTQIASHPKVNDHAQIILQSYLQRPTQDPALPQLCPVSLSPPTWH